ncbi:phosphatase PAP2 family protein [Rhizobium puerariae]|uniref:Phosphatase PAP2 family protein n=1 Tax=Rhizobium puerariae TaxID=1585791 RepID=A0ABV6ALC9_9HYPH
MAPFHAAVLCYSLAVVLLSLQLGKVEALAHDAYLARLAPVYLLTLPMLGLVVLLVILIHRTNDWGTRKRAVIAALTPAALGRIISGLLATLSFVIFMGSFTTFKNLMPDIRGGFLQDRLQADFDRLIHFGHDPGPALVDLLNSPLLLRIIEWNYSVLWALLGFIPVFVIATAKAADRVRTRYFMMVFTVWAVIGSLFACLFLSAGPAFYGGVTGDTARFSAILDFLGQGEPGSASAALFQAYLWNNHQAGTSALGSGISAFPSVHVGVATMNALFLREINRTAGLLGFAYVGLVAFSSVYLGWHYAIDGYASILVVILLHTLMRRMFHAHETAAREPAISHAAGQPAALTPSSPPTA